MTRIDRILIFSVALIAGLAVTAAGAAAAVPQKQPAKPAMTRKPPAPPARNFVAGKQI